MARPLQRWPQNETLAPQDAHNEYFSVQICTYGCKWPARKNEGMAELDDSKNTILMVSA